MGYDRIDSMYDALSKDGAQIGTRQQFKKLMLAPGKQGYKNRLGFYNAMKQDGAQIGNSYEDFARAMGLHAVKPQQARAQKPVSQPSKPMTTAERARQIGQEYMQGKAGKSKQASAGNTSSTDYMKNWQLMHKRNDQMTPVEQMQANTMRSRMQQAQKQASQQEQRRANPISQSRITPTAQNFNETMQQLSSSQAKRARAVQQREDDARNLAQYEVEGNQFAHNDGKFGTIAPEIDSLVAPSMKEADDLSWTQYQQDLKNAGNDAYLRNKAWKDLQDNRIKNRQNVLANNLSAKLQEIYSQKGLQEHIVQSADKLNMGVEEYVDKYVTPQMMQRAQNILGVKNIEEILPQSATEYVVRRLSDSILGTLSAGQDKSREQIAREQEAMAISDGLEEMPTVKGYKANEGYKSGAGARFTSTAANMAMDSPILGMTGGAANMSVDLGKQVLMRGLAKAGLVKMGAKLTAQQLAFKAANMTMAQKIASGLVEGSAKGALNLGGYSSITSALGQASTGNDTSLSALGKAALEGFEHGATTGAMFGVSGAIMAPWVSKFGINGLETSTGEKWLHGAQKLGATGVGLGVEAGTMMVADNITGDKDISVGTWLEDLVMVGAFKAGEPKNYAHIGSALYGLVHNTNNTFRVGKDQNGKWRTVDIHMTKDEQNELMNSVSGKNLVETFQKVDKSSLNSKTPLDKSITKQAYQDFMNDPNVSQSTKEKVNAAMGLFNTTSAKSYRSVNDVQNKQILEYSKNGTLLTRTSYKNADERRAILYKQKLYRDNEEMRSLAGYSKLKDLQPTDENGEVTRLAFAFLTDKGYNPNETVTEANNARLIAGLRDKNSDLYKEWEKYVDRFGSLGMLISDTRTWKNGLLEVFIGDREISLDTIMRKDPMKRTDEENKIFYQVKDALESELFPNGKPHADQSETQGQSVAEDNNLGTDQPNGEAVKQELNGLRQAETEMDVLMRDNDVFSQNFKKLQSQGLTNPQIYDWMVQNGLTQEQLEPFAHYINANARVQGMQEATKQKIEEVVSGVVQDWSYHGELNGQKMNGEQVVYVQDSEGRTLIVGSGDVAFDSTTGRAKEDVGDLLICFDPNTKEMVYLKKDDVTFMQTQNPDDFGNEYRQRLQMINSQPYNEAAQEQAMQDAGKSENQNQSESIGINQNQNSESNGSEKAPQVDTTSPEASTITAKNNTTKEGLAPQEQPQQTRKFADGTDVPMTKDSKGRPTPDYGAMKPEQAAEILSQDFGENAEKVVDGQIKKAEKALKDAEKMKVDYTAEPNDILEQEQVKAQTVEAAKKQLEQAQNIKKAMTAKAVAETVGKPTDEKVEGANEASSEVAKKFQNAPRLQGNHVSKRLPNGDKISGHYEIVPAESLTPSHDAMNDYKKSEGFPVDAEGRTINDRDYEHDKAAQQTTDQMAQKYSGQAITQVPTVSDEGIVYDGNGRTMAGQKAAKNGTDAEYIEDLMDNAQNYGFTKEQIEQSGIEHPRLVMVTDERLPYDTATFSMFNRNEKKTQSNTEQAVAKAKTLTSEEVGAIVADIEGNGSLDAFFNNSKAINDLVKTLVSKGVIGQNEVAGFMDGPDRLSAQGKEYVKNLLLGSVFKPETIRMLGVDSKIKNAAINGIRAIMDNLKLGDYSLRDELDQAVQLLYEARRSKMSVEDLLKQSSAFEENARDRFPMIAQAMAQALEDKPTTFRELMSEYNNIAKNYNTNEGTLGFYDKLTPEQVVEEFLNASKAIKNNNIKLYGKESETERSNDASGNEEPAKEAGGAAGTEGNGNAETEPEIKVKKALKRIATEITKQTGIEVVTDEKVGQSTLEDAEATDSNVKYSRVTDKDLIAQLEKEPKIKVYRAMQVIDGKLYPPMAAYADGKLVEANELGKWIQSDEMPDSKNTVYKIKGSPTTISKDRAVKGEDGVWRDSKTGKELVTGDDGEPTWYFKLQKGKGADGKKLTDVPAAYNPYWHLSYSPLNDQFKSAWIRPNIVVVECEVPASELNSGYRAEHAKNSVGMTPWTSGVVTKQLIAQGHEGRKVMLSRWCKPVRVVPDAEVAAKIKEFIGDHDVEIPENVVTPRQKVELEKLGVKIGAPEKGMNKNEQIADAIKLGLQVDNTVKEQRGSRWAGGEVLGMDKLPKENQMNPDELASEISQYHSDYITRMLENVPEDGTGTFFSAHNGTWYLYTVSKEDRSINLLKAFTASRENFDKFKEAIKDYGFNTETEDIYSNLQEVGRTNRSDSDLLDAFLRGGAGRDNRVHSGETEGEANNGNLGMDERTGEDTSSPRYFRSANGEVYGFTVDGKIYLDTKKMKPETPLHEYTHLWTEALRNSNPTEWENVKGLFDEVDGLKEEVQKLYPELKGDDLYEEMITTFSGREGAKKLEEVVRGLAKEDGKTVEESSKATGFIAKVKEALQKYWKGVADMLHIHFTSAEEVADKVLADWASGFNPNKAFDVNDRQGDYMKNNVEYIVKNTKLPFGKKYGEELSQEEVKSLFYGDNDYSKKYGKLFDRVYDVARKLGIKISFKIPPETYSAYGLADLDNVYLNPILLARGEHKVFPNKKYSLYVKEDTLPHAMLHELIHSVTAYALERYERDKDSMPKELRAAAESLIDLYEATRKATLDYVNEYGRENEQEFIAELSNPNFCKLLKKTNVWTRVKDAIKQFFFPLISSEKNVLDKSWKETNSYKELSSLLDDFLEHSDKGLFEEEIGVQNGEIKGKEEAKEEPVPIMPKPVDPSNPIEKAAEDYKKEHPLSEDEILNTTAFDGLPEDQKQYCIDAALDYLNGEDTSAISEAYYRNAYEKRSSRPAETAKVAKADSETVKAGQAEVSADPMEGIKNAAEGFEQEKAERERKQKEATQKVLNVIKASNEKAKTRKQLEAEKNAADNEFEAFMKELRKKQSGQLNSGFIDQNLIEAAPKMFSLAAKCAYTRIKLGMYDAKEVVKDLRNRFKDAFDGFDKRDVETFYSEIMNQKWRDGDKRMSLNEWAEHYRKLSPEYKEKLEGDSKDAEERKMSEKKFIDRVNIRLGFGQKINGIVELRKMAEECGLKDVKDTDLQELAETAIVQRARGIASSASTNDAKKFELIKKLYENQPSLNQRDSERVMKQQYSTPAPYAFLADMYVKGGGKEVKSALEPSAGNGMLTIGLPMDVVHVNDIDAQRLANLRRQGFKNVTSQDGTQPFADKDVDVVVTNPPFGSATPKEYDGYKISSLEGQMAINALESMKDDGRAAIIIGGKTEYAKNGSLNPKDKAFLGYLYSHYNVEDVINVDGSLYAKQGTTYPTRIILINGRRKFDPENKVYPPVEKNARAESVKDYDELYKRINDDILRSKDKSVDIHGEEKRKGDNAGGRTNVSDSTKENGGRVGRMGDEGVSDRTPANPKQTELDTSTRPVEQREDANGGTTESASDGNSNPDTRGGQTSVPQSERTDGSSGRGDNSISGGSNTSATDNGTDGRERGVRLQSSDVQSVSNTPTQPKEEKKQTLTTEKVAYTPSSHSMSLGAVVPARQKEALETVLNKLGDADQYLVDNLGYNDKEDLYAHLAAEQVDAVALGLKQMEKGNGFIIGDQTGIGKGRQAAAIIRYAVNQGRIPVSFTIKPNLFSDTYRDLTDIGSPELRPFILASSKDGNIKENYDEEVKGLDGRVTKVRKQRIIYNVPSTTETQRVLKYIAENGKLPEGYDYILTTYSQIRTGLQEYKGGKWKDKKKINAADRNGQLKRDAIEKLAENSIFILDESHDAAGEGSGSAFIQKVLPKAKGVTFLSATYAKTPDAMKLYALKTDLGSKSKDEKDDASWKILNAIKKGGTVFQEIMSQALTRSGQMIRRERDMTGVTIDWNPLTEDETEIQAQRDKFDNIFGIFNDILNFQRTYVDAKLGEMSDDVALIQGSVDHTPGTKDMGIGNVTFASKAYNVVQQALFSIKAEKVADYAIEAIKNGEKPVIAVNNTMEGMTDEYPMGEVMDMPDLNTTLMKGLEGILRYTEKNEYGDRDNKVLRLEELGEEAVARYNEIKEKIASATSGLSISPIDVIKHRLEQAGYRVGELTGRNTEFVYNEDGKVVRQKRTDTNKNALADRFNNGDLDVLILNRSASTGISLHASTKFKDQRQRTMIFAQMQGNINEEVQMRGRIDRTGQVRRGKYVYLVSSIPAEQRLMMMFKNKLKSLDANTTSSQKSKFNEVDVQDFTNKYGDEIVLQYMAQHPEYYNKLADPLGWGFMEYAKDGLSLGELRKNTKDTVSSPAYEVMKRLTLLPVKEQEVVLKDISDAYTQKIKQLNDMGMNDLEITDMPLEAKTLKREVWKEGSDPNGDNAFADNTYIETVEMNVLKKPMKAEEVQEAQKKMFGGKDYETWRSDKIAEIKEAQAAKIEETKAKMAEQMEKKVAKAEENTRKSLEKQNDKVQKKIDKGTQLAPGEHILTEEEIKTRISDVVADVKKKLLEKQSEAIANINTKYEMFIGPLYVCDPNKTVSVPSDWYMEDNATSSYPEFARVIGFKYDKNYNLGSSSIVFATTDSRKRVEIPLTRPKVLERIDTDTERFAKECKVITMDSWDRMIPKKDRTTGRIITGNMLEALADNNSIGHLISYTTDDGKVKQGILVPDSVSTEEITGNMPIAKAYNWFTKKEGGTELKSTDGNLRLAKNFGSMYTLYVPASRKEGGKYYLNKELLDLVHGHNFQSKGKNFWATFDAEKLHDVLHILNGMEVQVKTPKDFEESRTHFREDRGIQYSKTDAKDVKNSRIIPEDVDKSVSSQIEKTYDSAIEEAYKYVSEKDKTRLHSDVERDLREFSKMRREDIVNDIKQREYDFREWERSGATPDKGGFVGYRYARFKAAEAAAKRELDYRDARAKHLADTYGLQEGRENNLDEVARIYRELQEEKDKGRDALFSKALDIVKRLGTEFGGINDAPAENYAGVSTTQREVALFIDTLARTSTRREATAKTLLHEMIHQATVGAINLVRRGNAGGLLTPKQIDAVNTILDIYDKAVADGRIHYQEGVKSDYGGKNPYEFAAQMADTVQRKKLDLTFGQKVMNAFKELWNKGDRSWKDAFKDAWGKLLETSDKKKMDKAISDIMEDFNETIDDISMRDIESRGGTFADKLSNDSPVSSHIAQLSEKVGAKVNMVNSADEVTNKQAKEAIEEGKHITGWYDEKTGEVHLYMPNIHDRYTAEKTIWHEVVGHKGMRELFGEGRFRKFLNEVWDKLDKPEYANLKKLVDEERKFNPLDPYNAIEEGLARLAEEGRGEAGLWNNIKNRVSDFLHEIGYRLAPNTKDVKYLLWLSKNLQKNPNDPYWKMRAEAVKYRLDHERVPDVIAKDGMYQSNDGKARDLGDLPKAEYQEATDGQIHFRTTPSAGTALDRYHRSLDEHGYMFTESYMDNMLSLKNLMTAIVPGKKIEDIASSENPYMLQNTMQGAMSDAAQMFERNVMKPLDKAMAQVLDAFDGKKDDEKIRNFNLYMITKHGLERNRILYVRDALKDMRMDEKKKKLADTIENDWDNEKVTLDEKLERGDIDLKEYYKQMDDFIRTYVDETNKFDAGEHDYSGIHAIQKVEKNSDPYDDAEAIQSVMDSEGRMEDIKKGAVKDYWDKVKTATQYAIDCDYRNGLISRELYGHVSAMFNWYVPLRKYDEATAEDTYGYITEKGDPKSYIGKTIMRARGHKYLSETNILAQIGAMGNRAIKNGGQNAIKQAFARFIRNNSNNNLVTETSVWYVSDPITQTTVERYPDIPDDATADEISQIVSDFNMEMNDLASKGLATKVYRRGRIGYKFQRAENKSQHIVDVMIAGKKHSFIVNGNPRAAQALNGLLEHKNETGIGKIAGKISRFMAQTCTSYNPEFVMRNMIRDFEFASSNLLAKEGARYTGIFEKYYAKVGIIEGIRNSKLSDFKDTGGFGLFVKYRNGTLDTSDKIQRYFKEFMENGGETGWVQIKSMKEWTEEYKRDIKAERNKAVKVGKGFYNAIFKNLENVNEIAENMARFATYCASRDSNRSVVRSAYDAKEVSTNFNRHGSGSEIKSFKNGEMGWFEEKRKQTYRYTSAWFRNTSMFFNAGIQSTNLLVKNLKNNTAGTLGYIASGPMISGMAIALLNNFLIANEDEKDRKGVKDPYGELPDYIRRNNLCVYVGGGEFVTIPLAIEERAFYGLGDLVAGLTFSPNISGQKNPFLDAVGCMSQLVPVADYLGNASFGKHPVQETVKAVMPSATSPFIEWAYNSDWKGAPIERDNKFDENQPAWMLAYKGTPDVLLDLNKKVNAWTNGVAPGNEDMLGNSFLDAVTNPSGLQHFYSSYLGGAATFAERTLGLIKHGKDTETKDVPFVRSLFYTPSEQTSLQRTKSKWYNYKDEMEVTMANVDRLKAKNVPIDKRLSNIGEYYHFQNSKDAVKVRVIELAEKQMEQWKKLRDKSSDTESIKFANENIDRIMMDAVEQLDKLN